MNGQDRNIMSKGGLLLFHSADFHLGSPFSGLDVRESEARRRELLDSFASTCALAKNEGCSVMLIAGDLFDSGYADSETVSRVFGILADSGLPVVISPGNHDPYTEGGIYSSRSLPENVRVFESPEMSYFDFPELSLRVHGYAFESERYTADPLAGDVELAEGCFNVLCAHGDIYSPISTYAALSLARLEELGFDYVALGHIHKYSEPIKLGGTVVSYSGFPEGRSFDECGFGGALLVNLSEGGTRRAETQRVILSKKQYLSDTLDVTGSAGRSDLISAVKKYVSSKGLGIETALRLTLVGNVEPTAPESLSLTAAETGLALLEIRNETLPLLDAEYLENDVTLRGALYRQLLPALKSADSETRRVAVGALRMGLAALEGRDLLQ